MRVAIIGSGGIGAPYGAALVVAGADVTFVARGRHLAAMQKSGLRIEGTHRIDLPSVRATENPAEFGVVDLVLFCVKLWDVETAGELIRPIVGQDTAVIALQNGIDAGERLISILGSEAVMGGVAVGSGGAVVSPGVINTTGRHHRLIFGERDGRVSSRAEAMLDLFKRTSFEGVLSRDIVLEGWEKYTVFVAHSGLSALTRLPIGKLRDDPEVFGLYEGAMREVMAVGRAEGVRFPPDTFERQLTFLRGLAPDHRASMAVDLIQGNRLELTWLAGKVVELGQRHGIPTPINGVVYAALKPFINGTPV